MSIGADDYYLDLLFFHRPLRALVAIELKLGRFDARDKGQMELYLRWLDKHERHPGASTSATRERTRRWGSSFAPTRTRSRSSSSS